MASTTGIELCPESCVLVGIRPGRGTTGLFAIGRIGPAGWPAHDAALGTALRDVRRKRRLPRRARVVAWGLPQSAAPDDAMTRAVLRPLLSAGFRIEAVMHPAEALTALAASRKRAADGAAVAWLALNTYGAAIAIVRDAELLFSRTFDWRYQHDILTPKAQLLQRYSLVSHLAPELRRGIEMVQAAHGLRVDSAVTCGDLPDLRSLTMPLIEELDLEVETLDSTDGLRVIGRAKGERVAESASALRLASAAALASPRSRPKPTSGFLRAAAAVAAVGVLGWLGYVYWSWSPITPVDRSSPSTTQAGASTPPRPSASVPPSSLPPRTSSPSRPNGAMQAPQPDSKGGAPSQAPPRPGRESPAVGMPAPPAVQMQPVPGAPAPAAPMATPPRPRPVENLALAPIHPVPAEPRRASDERTVEPPAVPRPPARRAVPLNEPLPGIDSILIDRDRRLAVINGEIVGIGDAVGPRLVLEIERDAVVFREPSGFDVRVPLRARNAGYDH